MDIRNFFGSQKGGAPAAKKKTKSDNAGKPNNKSSNSSSKPKSSTAAAAAGNKDKVAPARDNDNKAPPSKKKQSPIDLMDSDEDEVVVRKKAPQKKKRIVDSDSDSDATTADGGDDTMTNNNNKAAKQSSGSDTTVDGAQQDEKDQKTAAVSLKKKMKPEPPKRKEVDPNDFFGSTTSSSDKKKRSSPRQSSKPKQTYDVVDWDDLEAQEEEEEEDLPVKKKASKTKKDSDEDEDFEDVANDDDDEDLDSDVDEEPAPSKKRSSARSKEKTPVKKQKVKEIESDDDDADDDDDYKEESKKPAKPPSRNKRASPPKSPPAAKKRKTPAASSSAKKKKEKEPLLKPTLELESFSSDDAVSECLQDLTFVFTGILPNLSRDDATDFVKCLGGRVTGAVSSKTSYVVVGEVLEDGRNYTEGKKYREATERGIHVVMGEKQLYGLAKMYSDKAKAAQPAAPADDNGKENKQNQAASGATTTTTTKSVVNNPYAKKVVNPYAKKPGGATTVANNPYAKKPTAANSSAIVKNENNGSKKEFAENSLWVDRFAPTTTKEILGNKENVNKLTIWLNRWESRFNNDKAVGKAFSNPQGPWKAALLSGPPGIGKTTTATLVAKETGRDLIEFNASDVRSKKVMHNNMGDITGSQSVEGYFLNSKTNIKNVRKRVVVMDEVDGMGGGDRGGMAELIQMIKHSRVPIICICNDRQSLKMKSLLPYCLDLRFRRPIKSQIATAAIRIAHQEGLKVERNAAEAIAESCGNDIRQVLNCLQMWNSESAKQDKTMTYKSLKDREKEINKDDMLRVNLFDGARLILEGRKGLAGADPEAERASFFKRNDAFFVDYSFTGLLVQQNYVKLMSNQYGEAVRSKSPAKVDNFLDRMHAAADSMSDFAMIENKIRGGSDMNWSLLPFAGTMAVKCGFHAAGPTGYGFPGFPEFTTWLGRNSSKGKKQRIIGELKHHMNYKISAGTQEVRLSYLPFLRDRLLTQLKNSEQEKGNKDVIQLMDDYGLDRDDLFENMDEFLMNSKAPKFADIDSKRKAAFTRDYNAGSHKSQALVDEQGAPKKTKRKGGSAAADPEDPDAIDDDVQAESSDEEEEEDVEKIKAAFKKKGRKTAASKAKKGAAATKGKGRKKK